MAVKRVGTSPVGISCQTLASPPSTTPSCWRKPSTTFSSSSSKARRVTSSWWNCFRTLVTQPRMRITTSPYFIIHFCFQTTFLVMMGQNYDSRRLSNGGAAVDYCSQERLKDLVRLKTTVPAFYSPVATAMLAVSVSAQ
ncbi:hypothetical protein ONE63_004535 [Megalurothrips usitatus]|uniref:Uncharacterized protein n=1 Tax=Megalurothrips usitatus TaxID=439358 RepID=A0AAV7X6M1_9NEOP|nr:hypothetical protein ONE63_004535 [Megalurothrips usitatus]